ncbi:MAG: lycopene cyclase family protein [Myxococcota bacterium]
MSAATTDIIIAGAGPAGSYLAAALAATGLTVTVVDPNVDSPWPNRYGAWRHQWDKTPFKQCISYSWPEVEHDFGDGAETVDGGYISVDTEALRSTIRRAASAATFIEDRVKSVSHSETGAVVTLASGALLSARLVVDATGSGMLTPRATHASAYQHAYGLHIRTRSHPWSAERAMLMDFSDHHLDAAGRAEPPSFLYALATSSTDVFVEETSLAAAPPIPLAVLEARLRIRLKHLGVQIDDILHVERCAIPMDLRPPTPGRIIAVGSAAGWVHPATGYQLTRTLTQIPAVARAIHTGLQSSAIDASRAGWQAVWPTAQKRTHALHQLGLGLLLTFDGAQTGTFFKNFFQTPVQDWRAYLDATASPTTVARSMAKVFASAPTDVRRHILRHAVGPGGGDLAQAVFPQLRGTR